MHRAVWRQSGVPCADLPVARAPASARRARRRPPACHCPTGQQNDAPMAVPAQNCPTPRQAAGSAYDAAPCPSRPDPRSWSCWTARSWTRSTCGSTCARWPCSTGCPGASHQCPRGAWSAQWAGRCVRAGHRRRLRRFRPAAGAAAPACASWSVDLRAEVLAITAPQPRSDVAAWTSWRPMSPRCRCPTDRSTWSTPRCCSTTWRLRRRSTAFREMRRVARKAVVVNDLRRGRLAYLMSAAPVWAFARGRYTRHDGPASARRAYTLYELDSLAAQAGLAVVPSDAGRGGRG